MYILNLFRDKKTKGLLPNHNWQNEFEHASL